MPFKYVAYNKDKQMIKGVLPVSTESLAIDTLTKSGLRVLSLKEVKQRGLQRLPSLFFSVKPSQVVLFSRQLAMLLERGTGFLTALRLSRDQAAGGKMRNILSSIISDIEAGSTFSATIDKHPKVFPLSYRRMVQVGEQTGKLEEVLFEVAAYMERDEDTKKKIKSMMIYPSFILVLGIITAIILTTVVLPPLVRLFDTFSAQLPWPTRALLAISGFLGDYIYHVVGVVLIVVILVAWYVNRPGGRYRLEQFLWKLPIIRRISVLRSMQNLSRIMAILLASGLSMIEVLKIAEQSAQSEMVRRGLRKIPDKLLQGQSLSQAMHDNHLFPNVLTQMVMLGENTNSLDNSFATMADHYEFEFNESVSSLTSMLEPVLMLIMGLGIGFVAVSVIMPIYSVYSVI
jgi:type IV pilus assembly protein PilC